MDHCRVLTFLALLFPLVALAAQGGPVYVDTGTPSGACSGNRVRISTSGAQFCCTAGTWQACGGTPSAVDATGVSSIALTAPAFTASDPTSVSSFAGTSSFQRVLSGDFSGINTSLLDQAVSIRNSQPSITFLNTAMPLARRFFQLNWNWAGVMEFNNAADEYGTAVQTICQMDLYNVGGTNTQFACTYGVGAGWLVAPSWNLYQPTAGSGLKRNQWVSGTDGSVALERQADDQTSSVAILTMRPRDSAPWNLSRAVVNIGAGSDAATDSTLTVYDGYPNFPTRLKVRASSAQSTNELFGVYANDGTTSYLSVTSGKTILGGGAGISASFRATATLATAAISAQTCATQAITVTGAAAGADCIVGSPAALEAGLVQTCVATATNTVTLRTCNPTAGTITPAGSQTVGVRVFNP